MSVQFEEGNNFGQSYPSQSGGFLSGGAMAQWLIKRKIAKDESSANKMLVAFIVICFGLIIYLNI